MPVTGSYMALRVRNSPLRCVRDYRECLLNDVLPAFNDLERRAAKVGDDEFARLGAEPADDDSYVDQGADAEAAEDKAQEFYETKIAGRQLVLNLFAAGLFHLLEQQVADLCRDGGFMVPPLRGTQLVGEVSKWYARHFGLRLQSLPSWTLIDELRLVANVTKHAEGSSAEELRERRPSLFTHPMVLELGPQNAGVPRWDVARPLAGEDLFVTVEILREYCDAAASFLSEIHGHFEAHANDFYPADGAPMPTIQQTLDRLINEFRHGNTSLQIAVGLRAGDPVILQLAPVFFGMSIEGNLELAQIYAARMYDKTRGAITIETLMQQCEDQAKSFNFGTEEQVFSALSWCSEAIKSIRPALNSIKKRRDKALAHLDPRFVATPTFLNTEASLTIPELETVYKKTEQILQRLDAVHSGTIGPLTFLGPDDYLTVLDLLADAKCREATEYEKEFDTKCDWPLPAKYRKGAQES